MKDLDFNVDEVQKINLQIIRDAIISIEGRLNDIEETLEDHEARITALEAP